MSAWLESVSGLRFQHPALLLLALLVPVALGWRRWRGEPALRLASLSLSGPASRTTNGLVGDDRIPTTWRVRLLPLPRLLEIAALLLVVVALARPTERHRLPHRTEGIDIVLLLDRSSSMAETDLDPDRTRLDLARAAATDFVAHRTDDRIGVVAFARYPDVLCPLTLDHRALAEVLAGIRMVEKDGPEDATGIGTAIARAAQTLQAPEAPSRVVILLTDGEENVARAERPDEIAPLHAAQLAEQLGVRVYSIVVGVGARGPGGTLVPLDTREVRLLAERTGGEFWEVRDARDLATVYATIDALETAALDEPRFELRERFLPWLGLALVLLLVGRLLAASWLEVLP